MTDLEVYRPPAAELAVPVRDMDSWIAVCSDVIKVANVICDTPFVPDGLRGSGPAVAAAILAGRELSLGPMTSLANIHVIKGKPALSAVLMRALVLAQGHQWEDVDVTDTRVVIRGRRKGESEWTAVTFTADQASKAKIDLGGYPQDKLYARATSRLARRKFADVIAGMPYSAEELEDGDDGEAGTLTETPAEANGAKPAARTARRRSAAASPPPASPAPPAASEPQGAAEPVQPPLPGEEEDEPKHGSVIHAHFRRLGFTDDERDKRLDATGKIVGRKITTTNELNPDERQLVADTLARLKNRGALVALLAAASQDAAAEAGDDSA